MDDSTLSFEIEWDFIEGIADTDLRATWAGLRITLGSSVITSLENRETGTVREFRAGPLLTLAETIATPENWEKLGATGDTLYLGGPGDGYPTPDLQFTGLDNRIHAEWFSRDCRGMASRYTSEGQANLSRDHVQQVLSDFVGRVVHRLEIYDSGNTYLKDLWMEAKKI